MLRWVGNILISDHHHLLLLLLLLLLQYQPNQPQVPQINNNYGAAFKDVLISALPLSFLTYMESVSVARKYALANRYTLDMTQELWALGIGCLAASFFKAYPPGGSFSRTALKAEIGVKTPFANIVTSGFVTIILMCATDLLKYVPMATLGAVICQAVLSLWDFHDMWRALWVAPLDFIVMTFTFLVTVIYNVEDGLVWGLGVSILILLYQISRLDMESVSKASGSSSRSSSRGRRSLRRSGEDRSSHAIIIVEDHWLLLALSVDDDDDDDEANVIVHCIVMIPNNPPTTGGSASL